MLFNKATVRDRLNTALLSPIVALYTRVGMRTIIRILLFIASCAFFISWCFEPSLVKIGSTAGSFGGFLLTFINYSTIVSITNNIYIINVSEQKSNIEPLYDNAPDSRNKIVQATNGNTQKSYQNTVIIDLDTLPKKVVTHPPKRPKVTHILKEDGKLKIKNMTLAKPVTVDANRYKFAKELALANLIGSWNENQDADIEVVTQIIGGDYNNWVSGLEKSLHDSNCPLVHKNGLWTFKDRTESWKEFEGWIFNRDLDSFKIAALAVLQVDDPSFELPSDERYAAPIYGKVLPYSDYLRKGLAETLALISNQASSLTRCSQEKAESIALLVIRELFRESNWIRWGSLNNLLPILSEANPDEFLTAVENTITSKPCPFDVLFEQEDAGGIFGINYITGLLSALEGIAWEEDYLARATIALAEIASHDPDGRWANRPSNSLTDIFLPWLPHTLGSVKKRQAVLKMICKEQKEVGWKLLESLLPNKHSTTFGTHKPNWRVLIPDNWKNGVTHEEYWEQSRFCAGLMVEQAGFDIDKLKFLAANYDRLPSPASKKLRDKLLSKRCINLSEEERMPIWVALWKLIAHHRRFPRVKWSLGNKSLLMLEDIANQLTPKSPNLINKQLFSDADAYLYEDDGNWEEKQERLLEKRKVAIKDILDEGGLSKVVEFALTVSEPYLVGDVLADFAQHEFDLGILPSLLDKSDHKQWLFVTSYVHYRQYKSGWQWFDDINKIAWSPQQIALLLCALPFEKNTWDRAIKLLGKNEREYWENVSAYAYQAKDDAESAFVKLLEFGRPDAVITCLGRDLSKEKDINPDLTCDALLALVESDELRRSLDNYSITKIIKALQKNKATNQDKLLRVEWAYASLLGWHDESYLITLENKLASDPGFFCELIQLIYPAVGAELDDSLSEQRRDRANHAYRLLSAWKVVPGTQTNKKFAPDLFLSWLSDVEKSANKSDHYSAAMTHLGKVLVNAPKGSDGLWIDSVIAKAMNSKKRSRLRDAHKIGILNSRGVHSVDPEAKPELALVDKYRERANEVENAGYHRLAQTLRDVANYYKKEAKRIISHGGFPD